MPKLTNHTLVEWVTQLPSALPGVPVDCQHWTGRLQLRGDLEDPQVCLALTSVLPNYQTGGSTTDHTPSSLRYANRTKSIQNRAHINEDPKDAMLREFQKEIQELRQKLEEGGWGL